MSAKRQRQAVKEDSEKIQKITAVKGRAKIAQGLHDCIGRGPAVKQGLPPLYGVALCKKHMFYGDNHLFYVEFDN